MSSSLSSPPLPAPAALSCALRPLPLLRCSFSALPRRCRRPRRPSSRSTLLRLTPARFQTVVTRVRAGPGRGLRDVARDHRAARRVPHHAADCAQQRPTVGEWCDVDSAPRGFTRSVWCARGRGSCLQDYPPHAHMPPPARERLSTGPQACLAPRRRRGAWLARPLADPAPRSVNALAPASSWRIIAARSRSRQRSRGRQAAALPGPVYSSRFKLNLVLSVRCHAPRCSCRLHPCP